MPQQLTYLLRQINPGLQRDDLTTLVEDVGLSSYLGISPGGRGESVGSFMDPVKDGKNRFTDTAQMNVKRKSDNICLITTLKVSGSYSEALEVSTHHAYSLAPSGRRACPPRGHPAHLLPAQGPSENVGWP